VRPAIPADTRVECLATLQAWLECDGIGTYVRKHGAGPGIAGLVPVQSPSGAPGLALLIDFP